MSWKVDGQKLSDALKADRDFARWRARKAESEAEEAAWLLVAARLDKVRSELTRGEFA